jgi:Domain of unknown function (DUF4326)
MPEWTPERIQLRRQAGWRIPGNTVKVDRSTRWGNPFRVDSGRSAAQAVEDFRLWVTGAPMPYADLIVVPPSMEEIRAVLAGKNLACWCPAAQPCHADVLLALANMRHDAATPMTTDGALAMGKSRELRVGAKQSANDQPRQ